MKLNLSFTARATSVARAARSLVLLPGLLCAATAPAQDFPVKPLRLVLPFAPGGSTDVIGRAVGMKLGEFLKQPVLIDNRAGAAGTVGHQFVAKSPADGYTILMAGSGMATFSVFASGLSYDPIADFAPIGTLADIPIGIFAGMQMPFRSIGDLIKAAKAEPGKYSYGTPGVGTSANLTCEILKFRTGIDLVHVPYKGNAPSVNDLMGGQIPLLCSNLAGVLPNVKAGRMRPLAVTGTARTASIADVPTFREAGIASLDNGTWMGLTVPVKTPAAIVTRMGAELTRVLRSADVLERFEAAGAAAMIHSPQEYTERLLRLRDDLEDFKKRTGFKLE